MAEWRARIAEYWFWTTVPHRLTPSRALQAAVIGDTTDGDELVVHPDEPERIYVLPRYDDNVYVAGDGLPAAVE